MSNLVDVVPLAIFTASSVDTTSSACANDACDASKVADSQAKSASDDATYWQTAVDPSCISQPWIRADWTSAGPYEVSSFTIKYGTFSNASFSGMQLTSTSAGLLQTAEAYNCNITSGGDPANPGDKKVEVCKFDPAQNGGIVWDAVASSFYFSFNGPQKGGCQLTIDEIIIKGTPSPGTNSGALNGASTNSVPGSGFSIGGIIGIVITCLLVAAGVSVWTMRQKNLRMRRLAKKIFLERRMAQNEYELMNDEDGQQL